MGESDQHFGGSWNAHKNWKKLRDKHLKRKKKGNLGKSQEPEMYVPFGGAGKGDKDRTSNHDKFELGMELIRIAKEEGKDSKSYKDTLKAWRNA